MIKVTAEQLRNILDYNPYTGTFTWKVKAAKNTIVGAEAGCRYAQDSGKKRIGIRIEGRRYLAHRLAWLHVHGAWPVGQIDHRNGNPLDNRICNLRECSNAQNSWNKGPSRRSRIGLKGVFMRKGRSGFYARIRIGDRRLFLGRFETAEDAHAAYCQAAKEHHREFARLA